MDWEGVIESVPRASEIASGQGLTDAEVLAILVTQGESLLSPTEESLHVSDDVDDAFVYLTAEGNLATSQEFALLGEADRAEYFHDADRFVAAVEEMLDQVGSNEIIDIGNYGDRLYVEAYVDADEGVVRV